MVNKKNNPEKGQRTVSIEFADKMRTLKFGHATVGKFESEANAILRADRIIEPGNMIFADRLMDIWLGNAKIFTLALSYALKDDPNPVEDTDAAIDSYIEKGGSKLELTRAIVTAYRYATNPSSVASLTRNWKISDDRQAILTRSENEYMDTVEKALQEAKEKLTPGTPSTDSQNLNSD